MITMNNNKEVVELYRYKDKPTKGITAFQYLRADINKYRRSTIVCKPNTTGLSIIPGYNIREYKNGMHNKTLYNTAYYEDLPLFDVADYYGMYIETLKELSAMSTYRANGWYTPGFRKVSVL